MFISKRSIALIILLTLATNSAHTNSYIASLKNHISNLNGKQAAVIAAATVGTLFLGTAIYEYAALPITDTELIKQAEDLCLEAEKNAGEIQETYKKELSVLKTTAYNVAVAEKFKTLFNTLNESMGRRPFLTYVSQLQSQVNNIDNHIRNLEKKSAELFERQATIISSNNADKHALIKSFGKKQDSLRIMLGNLKFIQALLLSIRQQVMSTQEYAIEAAQVSAEQFKRQQMWRNTRIYTPVYSRYQTASTPAITIPTVPGTSIIPTVPIVSVMPLAPIVPAAPTVVTVAPMVTAAPATPIITTPSQAPTTVQPTQSASTFPNMDWCTGLLG
ncbi:MAG: hypothetical protein NTX86_00440 [Candidatus Dependentiae bacterium]|nr:hypothetical protein [Candidatus Dependentiae bacterium]